MKRTCRTPGGSASGVATYASRVSGRWRGLLEPTAPATLPQSNEHHDPAAQVYCAAGPQRRHPPVLSASIIRPVTEKRISFDDSPLTTMQNCIYAGEMRPLAGWRLGTRNDGRVSSGSGLWNQDNGLLVGC